MLKNSLHKPCPRIGEKRNLVSWKFEGERGREIFSIIKAIC
jgi:hypothetical protein